MKEEKLMDTIHPLIQQIQAGYQLKYEWAKAEVHSIITKGLSVDLQYIDKILDVLSETAMFGIGEDLFRFFLAYVYAINVEMAETYAKLYLEMTSTKIDEIEIIESI